MDEDKLLEERKEKVKKFFKENPVWIFYLILFLLIILGVYIRMQPLLDHGGRPGLWDATTNDYTLGPDLDPFLFLRYAKTMITEGSLPQIDAMRNVPLSFDTTFELQMVSYMIVLTYKFTNLFGTYSINYAGAFMPVIFFALTILAFFLFVREIFVRRDDKESSLKANIIASISTLFMIILPGFLSRNVAGIPEKESVGFFFMFLAFYLFIKAWKSEKLRNAIILGTLSGVSTALMGLTWGGVIYIYATMAIVFLAAIILNKVHKKEAVIYASWVVVSFLITLLSTNRFSLKGYLTSFDTGMVVINLMIIAVHFLIWKTSAHQKLKLDKIRLPKPVISLLITIILLIIIISIIFGPGFIIDKIKALNQILISPVQGRWNTTVAENRQPYFTEWVGNFGKFIFWTFVAGSILLFYKMFHKLKKKQRLVLTACYVFFLFGLMFSRYAPYPAVLNGEGFISKLLYYGASLLLVGVFGYYYLKNNKNGDNSLESIEYEYIFLFSLFALTLFTARSAVRLIMVLVPIAPIFLAYIITEISARALKEKDKNLKIIFAVIAIFLLAFSAYQAYGFYKNIKATAYSYVPSYYTIQWQQAMSWVRENTPQDAVFAHWWDYGYWVQSIGERATVTDGGNAITWWNYLTGRFVLTGDNQRDALEFLYNHNATYLLIDSTDIGKYGAYSQIGSNETFDRLSQGPFALVSDDRSIQETKNEIIRTYNRPSGNNQVSIFPIEEDIIYNSNNAKTYLLKENTGIIGITVNYSSSNDSLKFNQPQAVFVTKGRDYVTLPMRYLKYQDKFYDFGSGIEAGASIIQRVSQSSSGLGIDNAGALIYLSPRVFRGMVGQLYILDDPLKRFSNFNLVHSEQNLIIDSINQQGANLTGFVYLVNDLQGPIKIWDITYTGNEKVNPEYLLRSPPEYITWKF